MSDTATRLLKTSLSALHYSGAARLLAPATRGAGAVLMLHHVAPARPSGFNPNRILSITPQFLDDVVREVVRTGFDCVSMDEAAGRLDGSIPSPRPFVAFTFDDGYRDNKEFAYPVMKRHGVPMTIYATSDFAEQRGFLWWLVLEMVVARRHYMAVAVNGRNESFRCETDREKTETFERVYWWLRSLPEAKARAIVAELAAETGIDIEEPCRNLCMTWDELREIAAEPLVTIGAHTRTHMALARLSAPEAWSEMQGSIRDVETNIGRPCRHFCYPYGDGGSAGDREFEMAARLGMTTAVTTRKGTLPSHAGTQLTSLPRLSLNGDYQRIRYVKALLSGLPFKLLDAAQRLRRPAPATGA